MEMYFCTGIFVKLFGTIEIIIIYLVNGNILRLLEVVHCQANNAIRHSIQTQLHAEFPQTDCCHSSGKSSTVYIYIIFKVLIVLFFPPPS